MAAAIRMGSAFVATGIVLAGHGLQSIAVEIAGRQRRRDEPGELGRRHAGSPIASRAPDRAPAASMPVRATDSSLAISRSGFFRCGGSAGLFGPPEE